MCYVLDFYQHFQNEMKESWRMLYFLHCCIFRDSRFCLFFSARAYSFLLLFCDVVRGSRISFIGAENLSLNRISPREEKGKNIDPVEKKILFFTGEKREDLDEILVRGGVL
jgi:hypothetical protein